MLVSKLPFRPLSQDLPSHSLVTKKTNVAKDRNMKEENGLSFTGDF